MARPNPKPVRPGAVRAGDRIQYLYHEAGVYTERTGIVGRLVDSGSKVIASTIEGGILFTWDTTRSFVGILYIIEASRLDTLTELDL